MYQITVCGNRKAFFQQIESILRKLLEKKQILCQVTNVGMERWESGQSFGKEHALYIVEVVWEDNKMGLAFAQEIRQKNPTAQFILLADTAEFWEWGYALHAITYLVYPIQTNKLEDAILYSLENANLRDYKITVKDSSGSMRSILQETILYIEIINRDITIHLKGGVQVYCRGTLNRLEEKLSKHFLRCHSSFVVNMEYIRSYRRYEFLLMDGSKVRISKQNYNKSVKAYQQYQGDRM